MKRSATPYIIALLTMLALTTVLFVSYCERYDTVGKNRLFNGDFSNGLESWQTSARGVTALLTRESGVHLASLNTKQRVQLSQNVIIGNERLMVLSAEIKSADVLPGNRKWKAARLTAVQNRVSQSSRYGHPKRNRHRDVISTIHGTTNWKTVSGVVAIQEDTESMDVVFEILRVKGSAMMRNVSLVEVEENQGFTISRFALKVLWGLITLTLLGMGIRAVKGSVENYAIISVGLTIIVGVILPAGVKSAIGNQLAHLFPVDNQALISLFGDLHTLDELMFTLLHLLGFYVLSLLLYFQSRSIKHSLYLGLYVLIFALCTEALQLLSEARQASLQDVLIDATGILAGWFTWLLTKNPGNNTRSLD